LLATPAMSLPILLLRTIAGAAIAALLAPSVGVCADGQQPPGVAETTEVFGQLPGDLAGRWLIVNQIKLPSGERRSYPHLWEIRPSGATGSFVVTSIAAAPLPIPITLKGDFQTHRVGAPPPPPSMLQRMLDFFSGCRRG